MNITELIGMIRSKTIVPFMTFEIYLDDREIINWEQIENFAKQNGKVFEIDEEEALLDLSDCDDFFQYKGGTEELSGENIVDALDKRFCEKIANFLGELNQIARITEINMACRIPISEKEESK